MSARVGCIIFWILKETALIIAISDSDPAQFYRIAKTPFINILMGM